MPSSTGIVGKALGFLFFVALLLWIVRQPVQASVFANNAITFVQKVHVGMADFLNRVVSHATS